MSARITTGFGLTCLLLAVLSAPAAAGEADSLVADRLRLLPPGAVHLTGPLDEHIRHSIEHHLKALDYPKLVDYFRLRTNPFASGEFWGKTVRSACPLQQYAGDEALKALLAASVADLLSTQTADGCISARTYAQQPQSSDLWERKYVLLGLLGWYGVGKDQAVLDAMVRMADYTLGQIGSPPKTRIVDTGWAFQGIESSSILEPMVRLYRLTGHQRYLDFARYIVETEGACKRGSIFAAALAGTAPKDIDGNGNPKESIAKAYESMSCFEGLLEYYRATGVERWRDAAVTYYRAVRAREITIIGSGGGEGPSNTGPGTGEQWNDLALDQSSPRPRLMMETCVTVTWMKFCLQVLRTTGDATVVDEIERSVYNALLGAMKPSGDYWDYFQNLNGARNTQVNFSANVGAFPLSCCTANGPMGLAVIPAVAVMATDGGPAINLYIPGSTSVRLPDGGAVRLDTATTYPREGAVDITVTPTAAQRFPIALRIPAWSAKTTLTVNGQAVAATPGTYAIVNRLWSPGDRIALVLDLRCRLVPAPHGSDRAGDHFQALVRGPVVLARDRRLGGTLDAPVAIQVDGAGFVQAKPVATTTGARMQFLIPTVGGASFPVIDYASAGNTWDQSSAFRVWLPMAAFPNPQWIWHPEYTRGMASAPVARRWFRRDVDWPAGRTLKRAVLRLSADDACVVFVNGRRAGECLKWQEPITVDCTADLRAGRNVIAVEADNRPSPGPNAAGLIAVLTMDDDGGERTAVVSDGAWLVTDSEEPGWRDPDHPTSAWKHPSLLGYDGAPPWQYVPLDE